MPAGKKAFGGLTGRYVLRHTLRSPSKSLICLVLSAIFMLGLMLIRVSTVRSENEIEYLYTTTTVTVEIVKNSSAPIYGAGGIIESGFVFPSTVERLIATNYISHCYVESSKKAVSLIRLDSQGTSTGNGTFDFYGESVLFGIEYPQEFLSTRGITDDIIYFEDWDESIFLQSWNELQKHRDKQHFFYPVVISQALYNRLQMEDGDILQVAIETIDLNNRSQTILATTDLAVVGIHSGDLTTLLLPVGAFRGVNGVNLNYDRVVLTVDPVKNRQLDEFRTLADAIIPGGGVVPLTAIYWDQELRQAIAPMEQVISFMKTLYPVTLALSFIVAAGIAILLSLLSAKEAAILRVLGNSKMTCRVTLCLQTILPCMVGLVVGHLGAAAMAYLMLPAQQAAGLMLPALGRAGLYLLYTALGAVGASAVMTSKNPLELLQVKE